MRLTHSYNDLHHGKAISRRSEVPGPRRPGHARPAGGHPLGRFGINLGQFVQQFNERTKEAGGMPIPVVVKVYNDRSFEFVTKSPPPPRC